MFIDSDDYIHEEMLQTLYETAERGHYDIVKCNYSNIKRTHNDIGVIANKDNAYFFNNMEERIDFIVKKYLDYNDE